jgi:hypothetical protein
MADLGGLKYLKLKQVWPREADDFAPWLVQDENLAAFSQKLGIELQFERAQVPVGPYFADILAKDSRDQYVVIEIQFNRTDHDHLGKLITYGATLGASTVIWIAEQFTEEHQRAIEWLNEHTSEELSLFAVRPKVLQIDDSRPAVEFEVVERPNELVKAAAIEKSSGEISESRQIQLALWEMFKARLLEKKVVISAETPAPKYWFNVPLGRSFVHLSNILNTDEGRVGLRVYLHNRVADLALEQLAKDRTAIEQELGTPLQWNPNPENRDKTILLSRDIDLSDREGWPAQIDWLVEMNAKFRQVFMPRIKKLDLSVRPTQPTI